MRSLHTAATERRAELSTREREHARVAQQQQQRRRRSLNFAYLCVIVVAAARAASFPFSTTLHSMSVAVDDAVVVSWNSNVDRNCCSRHNLTLYTLQNISCVYVCVRVCVCVCVYYFPAVFLFLWYDKLPLLSALIIPKKEERKSITNTLLAGKTFAFVWKDHSIRHRRLRRRRRYCVLILWRCGW